LRYAYAGAGAEAGAGYTTYFFQLAGLADPFTGTVIIQVILVVGIIGSFYLVERVGRRTLVLLGGAVMSVVCVAIGGLGFAPASESSGAGLITLCSVWVFVYSLSLAPIGWITVVEVSTPALRAKTASIATVINISAGLLFVSGFIRVGRSPVQNKHRTAQCLHSTRTVQVQAVPHSANDS
jgi:hypothetical protein